MPCGCNALFVIEVLEPFVSRWMFLEIQHVSRLVGFENLWITRVRRRCERELLARVASRVYRESVVELEEKLTHEYGRLIVLDPSAEEPLSPGDFPGGRAVVVVGGIMGAHPPLGRTKSELTKKLRKPIPRNLGKLQMTIDGAAFTAREICSGRMLQELELLHGLTIHTRWGTLHLPYAYPMKDGMPVIAPGEIDYVLLELEDEESAMVRGRRTDICATFREVAASRAPR
jgi:ribosome biogenesis SPOUT family RNA methylase Rps3